MEIENSFEGGFHVPKSFAFPKQHAIYSARCVVLVAVLYMGAKVTSIENVDKQLKNGVRLLSAGRFLIRTPIRDI